MSNHSSTIFNIDTLLERLTTALFSVKKNLVAGASGYNNKTRHSYFSAKIFYNFAKNPSTTLNSALSLATSVLYSTKFCIFWLNPTLDS